MEFRSSIKNKPELNMTPLIDVVFLLIVFLMLTNGGLHIKTIDLNLPQSSSAENPDQKDLVIAVDTNKNFYLGEKLISKQELSASLLDKAKENPQQLVLLNVAKELNSQDLVNAIDVIRKSGINNLSLGTK